MELRRDVRFLTGSPAARLRSTLDDRVGLDSPTDERVDRKPVAVAFAADFATGLGRLPVDDLRRGIYWLFGQRT